MAVRWEETVNSTKKIFHRLGELKPLIETLYLDGITRGKYLGFENLHEYFSMKEEGTTYFYGAPFSGKSELIFELLLNTSELYGWHHVIYSPESGTPQEIYAELLSKYARKPFFRNMTGFMLEEERISAENFIHEYFFVIDPKDTDLTIEDFYSTVIQIEKEYGVKINTTCCDPFNELKHNFSDDSGRQDLYIENKLGFIRRDAFTNHRHNVIITHCRDQQHMTTKDGRRFYPPATPRELAGGQAWYRKAMNLICVWRPPFGMNNEETGMPYEENEVHIIINKYKPKGVGKRGTVKLYFDTVKNRYYETIDGERRYAGKQLPQAATQYQF